METALRRRLLIAASAALLLACGTAMAATDAIRGPARARVLDVARRLDVNLIDLCVTNAGQIGFDLADGRHDPGLIYPRGSGNSLLFASGLWLGGLVGGATRVTVAYYSSEFGPGRMIGGVADDAARAEYRVYKVARWSGLPLDTAHVERSAAELATDSRLDPLVHHSWSEYMSGAATHGAPWRVHRLPNTATPDPSDSVDVPGPDLPGDRMLWCVFNDADPALHADGAGSTPPLGVEVSQSVFAYDRPGPLGSTAFVRFDLRNRGSNTIDDMRAALWADPDVGIFYDDLVGCMESRSLGYAYNPHSSVDPLYGAAVPALGFDLLSAHPSAALGRETGMDAFALIWKANDPQSANESFNLMRGLQNDGTPVVDPVSGRITTFMVTGDPVLATGWLDQAPLDKRLLCSSGPWTLAPGDSLTLWVALVIGQADTPTGSVAALRCADDYVQNVFDAGFAEPYPAPPVCFLPEPDCPRSADWWSGHCAGGTGFSTDRWRAIAHFADSASALYSFTDPLGSADYCERLTRPASTARDSAEREYLALLSNVAAGRLGLVPDDGPAVRLGLGARVNVPLLTGGTIAQMIADTPDSVRRLEATYENVVQLNRRALEGVNFGLVSFNGGAGPAFDFLGESSIDPRVEPDSFTTVELRFSRSATQRAYRFLRLEKASDGGVPPQGRLYPYAGYRDVPMQAWDTVHGRPLELAFAERTLTADDGTILPDAQQPSTRDSTWGPDDSSLGGREYLWVIGREYSGAPVVPNIGHDGAPVDGSIPLMWALIARLRSPTDVVDDGDLMRLVFDYPPTASAERLLQWLQVLPTADTSAVRRYRQLAASLSDVNHGLGIGAVCGERGPSPARLIEASASVERGVMLRWLLASPPEHASARLEVRLGTGVWLDIGPATVEGREAVAMSSYWWPYYSDPPSLRVAYRLALAAPVGIVRSDSVWVSFPSDSPALAFAGGWPNPSADGRPRVAFTLPVAGTVRLDVHDLSGRRVATREIPGLDPGLHLLEVAPGSDLRPGIYFVALRFGAERRTARVAILR